MINKTLKIMFVMILISVSFAYAIDSCDSDPYVPLTIRDSQIYATTDYIGYLIQDLDVLERQIEDVESALQTGEVLDNPTTQTELQTELDDLRAEQEAAEDELRDQRNRLDSLNTQQRLSTVTGFSNELNKLYNDFAWMNYYIDKWGIMGDWKSKVDQTFAKSFLGIEPLTSHICSLWSLNSNSPSNMAFGEDGTASAHIEGVAVETAEDNPVPGGAPIKIIQYRVTFATSDVILITKSEEATIDVNLYALDSSKLLGSYKLGKGVSFIGAQGDGTLVSSGGAYVLACMKFPEVWRYKGAFRNFLRKCPDKNGDCLCNSFITETDNDIPGQSAGVTDYFAPGDLR